MRIIYGFTLLELSFVIGILSLSICITLPNALTFIDLEYATITMRQLQQAVAYARSSAILHRQEITICPCLDGYRCGGHWQQGILVITPNGVNRFFKSIVKDQGILTLEQSANSNDMVSVQANGMTYTNGHFTYKSLNARYIPQFKLYFNRGLRTYVDIDN